jgi:ketosteroid isomerase-like protein
MRMWLATWQTWVIELVELVPAGDKVVALSHLDGTSRTAGIEMTQYSSEVWTFRDGLIVRCDAYLTREEGLVAAGVQG